MSLADESSLLFIPTGYKESKIYSVFPTTGVGDFTFNRNSSATRIAKNGLITSVATDIPRLEYPLIDGVVNGCPSLLLEPERRNRIIYTENFSNAAWTKSQSSITSNSIISPDGTLSASKLTEDTSNSTHRISDVIIVSASGVVYTQSIFAKSGGNGRFLRLFRGSGTYNYAVFDLDNGTVFSQGGSNIISTKIEEYPNGWYKCSSTFTTQFGNIATYYGLQNGNLDSYTGDGTSGVYIFGAQLEEGSYATSYIPNYGTSAGITRSADSANGAGDASTFNDSEGVLMMEGSALDNLSTDRRIAVSDGTTSNRVFFYYAPNTDQVSAIIVSGGATQVNIPIIDVQAKNNKFAIKYKVNDVSFWVNGFEIDTDTVATMPSNLSELAFDDGSGASDFYGKTKQIQYFQTALTDSELEELTSWTSFTDLANGQQYSIK